jgi:hypothetical protein
MLNLEVLRGVLFRSTIRGGHASLAIAVTSCKNEKIVLVVIRFGGSEWNSEDLSTKGGERSGVVSDGQRSDEMKGCNNENMTFIRSNVRRLCKIGNELEFVGYFETRTPEPLSSSAPSENQSFNNLDRFVVDYHIRSSDQDIICENLSLIQAQKWDATRCQMLQKLYFPVPTAKQQAKPKRSVSNGSTVNDLASIHHKSGLGKQKMGEVVADFLLYLISALYGVDGCPDHISSPKMCDGSISEKGDKEAAINKRFDDYQFKDRIVPHMVLRVSEHKTAFELLEKMTIGANGRKHSGYILDVAGGAGHVSLALALRNVKSTVIDPRSTVGSLPGRDRKVLRKSKKDQFFDTYRAWFGARPEGIDTFFREGCRDYFVKTSGPGNLQSVSEPDDEERIPVCTIDSEDKLIPNCTAIVALHPDEATGVIIETAVKYRIPFVVV